MVFATETAPAASIYATRTAVRAALAGMQPSEADAADAGDAVLVTIRNLAFETNRDGLAEHLRLATGLSFDREPRRVELVTSSNTGRNVGRARVSVPSRAEAEVVVQKVDGTELDGRTLSLRFADPKLDDAIVTIRNLPPETRIGDVTRHVKRVTERGSVGRIVFKKKDQSVDVAFRSRAGAEAAALQLDGTELAGRTLSARVSPRKTRSVSPRPAAPPAPPSSNGSPRAGARSREAVVAALSAWVAARRPDRTHSRNLDAFYKEHPHLGRKPKGSAWLTPDLLAAQGLQQPPGAGDVALVDVVLRYSRLPVVVSAALHVQLREARTEPTELNDLRRRGNAIKMDVERDEAAAQLLDEGPAHRETCTDAVFRYCQPPAPAAKDPRIVENTLRPAGVGRA